MYGFSLNFPNPREVSRVHRLFIVPWKVVFCGDESLGHRLQNRLRVNHCLGNSVRIPVQASCVLLQQIREPKKALSRELNGAALMRSTVVCAVSSAVRWTLPVSLYLHKHPSSLTFFLYKCVWPPSGSLLCARTHSGVHRAASLRSKIVLLIAQDTLGSAPHPPGYILLFSQFNKSDATPCSLRQLLHNHLSLCFSLPQIKWLKRCLLSLVL